MKILLLGEYSGLHQTLAIGLRELGQNVTVISDGDAWKNYDRDIDFKFSEKNRKLDIVIKLLRNIRHLIGYDVVQLINPNFLNLTPKNNLRIFKLLQRFNKNVFLGANGIDYFVAKYSLSGNYTKCVINLPLLKTNVEIKKYINAPLSPEYSKLNIHIASKVAGITACCAEYQIAYNKDFKNKLCFIPLPIQTDLHPYSNTFLSTNEKLIFFLGHYSKRGVIKGTDVLKKVLLELEKNYPEQITVNIAEGVPFETYQHMLDSSNVLCDQLYSYGCGMNGALGLSKGLVVAGGGEDYMYKLFGEEINFPIINLPTTESEIYKTFEALIKEKDTLYRRALRSREFAIKHHNYLNVAKSYLAFWKKMSK